MEGGAGGSAPGPESRGLRRTETREEREILRERDPPPLAHPPERGDVVCRRRDAVKDQAIVRRAA